MKSYLILNIPDHTWRKFKKNCVDLNVTIRSRLLKMLQDEVDSYSKEAGKE